MPFSVNEDGPSATIFFHGGDIGLGFAAVDGGPSVFLLLLARSPSLSSSMPFPFSFCVSSSVIEDAVEIES